MKSENPPFTIKTAVVTTEWPGATAKQMADLVSKQIENEAQSIAALDYAESKNIDEMSSVYFNIKAEYRDMTPIFQEIINKVNIFVTPNLPPGVGTPQIDTYFGDVYGIQIALSGENYTYDDLYTMTENLRKKMIANVPQIGQSQITGIQEEVVYIDIDNSVLATSGINLEQIGQALSQYNVILPSGNIQDQQERINIYVTGNVKDPQKLGKTVIRSSDGKQSIFLDEIATIRKTYIDPPEYQAHFNGKKALFLGLSLRSGGDIMVMGEGVQKVIKDFKETLPNGVDVDIAYYQPNLVGDKIAVFVSSLLQSIVIIIAIIFVFQGLRSGLIVASLTPTSIAFTLLGLYLLNYGLNQVTLTGLIIALGMLVDNAVVMSDSVLVKLQDGKDRFTACMESADDLAIPLFTSSSAVVIAFSPVALNKQNLGQFVGPMAVVVLLALLASWLFNQTLIPLLCYDFIKVGKRAEVDYESWIYKVYRRSLIPLLHHKWLALLGVLGFFYLGIFLFRFIPESFTPPSTDPLMETVIQMPNGTSIETTKEIVEDLSDHIQKNYYVKAKLKPTTFTDYLLTGGTTKVYDKDGVLNWSAFIGGGAPRYALSYSPEPQLPYYAYILYQLTDFDLIRKYQSEINQYMQRKYPNIDITTKGMGSAETTTKSVGYQFMCEDIELLKKIASEVKAKLRETPGTRAVSDNWNNDIPRIFIDVDQVRAAKAGLTSEEIAEFIQYNLDGYKTSVYHNFDAPPQSTVVPIYVRGKQDFKDDIDGLLGLSIMSANKESVPLKQVADLRVEYGPGFVYTRQMEYTIEVDAGLEPGYSAEEIGATVTPWIEKKLKEWGPEVKMKLAGDLLSSSQNNSGILAPIPIALVVMFIIIMAQFNSVKKAVSIFLSVPLEITGAAIGLLVTGKTFDFFGTIGMIALAGVMLNHSIVLIDKIAKDKIAHNLSQQDSVIAGCQSRLRPIYLTIVTTMCGLLPLYFFGGTMFQSLAAVLIFGLIMDLPIVLIALPIIYVLLERIDFKGYKYNPDMMKKIK
jgi:multidrug efflux pump subunit AcrB